MLRSITCRTIIHIAEKVRLEARLTIIEHLLMLSFAGDSVASGGDPLVMARQFSETLRQSLEAPLTSDLPAELSPLFSESLATKLIAWATG